MTLLARLIVTFVLQENTMTRQLNQPVKVAALENITMKMARHFVKVVRRGNTVPYPAQLQQTPVKIVAKENIL